eukprot:4009379-Prymnesium_polylepis.1
MCIRDSFLCSALSPSSSPLIDGFRLGVATGGGQDGVTAARAFDGFAARGGGEGGARARRRTEGGGRVVGELPWPGLSGSNPQGRRMVGSCPCLGPRTPLQSPYGALCSLRSQYVFALDPLIWQAVETELEALGARLASKEREAKELGEALCAAPPLCHPPLPPPYLGPSLPLSRPPLSLRLDLSPPLACVPHSPHTHSSFPLLPLPYLTPPELHPDPGAPTPRSGRRERHSASVTVAKSLAELRDVVRRLEEE